MIREDAYRAACALTNALGGERQHSAEKLAAANAEFHRVGLQLVPLAHGCKHERVTEVVSGSDYQYWGAGDAVSEARRA